MSAVRGWPGTEWPLLGTPAGQTGAPNKNRLVAADPVRTFHDRIARATFCDKNIAEEWDDMDHYDLLARPGWTAESILVVSPYVERVFFERIINDLTPTTLIVVIDDGCRADEVAMIQSLARKGTKVRVVLGSAPGLVHAKIFHVEWLTTGGNRAHTLVYGSGNATRQAFAGDINQELMCRARLTVASHSSVLDWMKQVRRAASDAVGEAPVIPAVRDAWLADGVHIRLPALMIKNADNKASNFDLWLQRGRLLSRFQPDASFLRVSVSLREALPAGDLIQRIQKIGIETPILERLRIPYIESLAGEDDGNAIGGNWLSHFFIWTQLGFWCSDACFRKQRDRFKRKGHEQRLENLRLLKELETAGPRGKALSGFLTRISELWAVLGDQASIYLESCGGTVDQAAYQALFDQRLERDLELAEDNEFRDRYINGCEIIDVPRFRTDANGWRSFVESFMRQLHVESLKSKSQSYIYDSISNALVDKDYDIFDNTRYLQSVLRSDWNKVIEDDDGESATVGEYIDSYQGQ